MRTETPKSAARSSRTTGGPPPVAALRPGPVHLVGAGPGDPELLTVKALRILAAAEVVLFDRLVDPRVLALADPAAQRIAVGKSPGGRGWRQADIESAMIEHARAGRRVVRLKSGDPMVFGRADEEIAALAAAGIAHEVVPGVTSALAAAAALGASLTRRGRNRAFTLLTAQDSRGFAEHDWRYLARPGATFAIYMGVRAARFVQGRLLLHGARGDTPIGIVERVSQAGERLVPGELARLDALLREHAVRGPAVILVGAAAPVASEGGLELAVSGH